MSFTQQSFGMSWSFKLPGRQANPYLSRTPIFAKFARRRGSVQRSILWSIGHLLRSTFVQQKDEIYKNTKIWITKFGITMEVYSSTHYQPCLPTGLFFLRGGGPEVSPKRRQNCREAVILLPERYGTLKEDAIKASENDECETLQKREQMSFRSPSICRCQVLAWFSVRVESSADTFKTVAMWSLKSCSYMQLPPGNETMNCFPMSSENICRFALIYPNVSNKTVTPWQTCPSNPGVFLTKTSNYQDFCQIVAKFTLLSSK